MSAEDAREFADEEYKLASAAGFRTGEYLVLFRIEDAMIQPQEVIEAFQANVATARIRARRIAVVAGMSLTRKQAERILQPRVAAIFSNALDAEKWLFSDSD